MERTRKRKSRFSSQVKEDVKNDRAEKMRKSIQEQVLNMKNMIGNHNQSGSMAMSRILEGNKYVPSPLLLNEEGQQVDASGKVVDESIELVATVKANRVVKEVVNPYLAHHHVDKNDRLEEMDGRIKTSKRETRGNKSLEFVQQGRYVKQAESYRNRMAQKEMEGKMLGGYTSGRNPKAYNKADVADFEGELKSDVVLNVPLLVEEPIPNMEWWDVEFLPKEKKEMMDRFGFILPKCRKENPDVSIGYDEVALKYCGTAHLIEHTARVKLLMKKQDKAVVVPLMLTAAERKRIRRQNRAEREKEKQDKIALGLLPNPEPKVKLSNMMRVLQEQAVADPSAIEKQVREQVAQRLKNHEMRNQARKLTQEQRREKTKNKLKADAAGDIHVAVFRVLDLTNTKNRFKVDVNAQQLHLTGGVLTCQEESINMVFVEGGPKSIKTYIKLMTRRIDWNLVLQDDDAEEDEKQDDEQPDAPKKENRCDLVWQGILGRRVYNTFRFQECRTAISARKVMETKNCAHYWDMVYMYKDQ